MQQLFTYFCNFVTIEQNSYSNNEQKDNKLIPYQQFGAFGVKKSRSWWRKIAFWDHKSRVRVNVYRQRKADAEASALNLFTY